MRIKQSTKAAIEKRFTEQFGVRPYAIERTGKDKTHDIYFVQSQFHEREIGVNRITGEAIGY